MTSLTELAAALPGYQPQALPLALAQACMARAIRVIGPVTRTETVVLAEARGRVLAQDCIAPFNVPGHDNAAMDGYAFRHADLHATEATWLPVQGMRLAGPGAAHAVLAPGHCLRIMTGAPMPLGADTVLPQELAQWQGEALCISPTLLRAGEHRRFAGEDLAQGSVALAAGRRLRAADMGLLAALGHTQVHVRQRLRVAVLSSGDELRPPGQPLPEGCVYDSNRHTLQALLTGLGFECIDGGLVLDQPHALSQAFQDLAQRADVIISSGGVSVGEADHTRQVMRELGDVLFWQIAMRPGRPLAFGQLPVGQRAVLLFGLPGNPVAVMVTFYALVRDALLQLQGATPTPLPSVLARARTAIRKKPGRSEFQRGVLSRNAQGEWQVELTGHQGSGILSSMSQAHGLIALAHEQGEVAAGDWVEVWAFEGLD